MEITDVENIIKIMKFKLTRLQILTYKGKHAILELNSIVMKDANNAENKTFLHITKKFVICCDLFIELLTKKTELILGNKIDKKLDDYVNDKLMIKLRDIMNEIMELYEDDKEQDYLRICNFVKCVYNDIEYLWKLACF
jgi:DNA polymerase III epsilon subunit-like protein